MARPGLTAALLSGDRSGIADIDVGAEVHRAMAQRTDARPAPTHGAWKRHAAHQSQPTRHAYTARGRAIGHELAVERGLSFRQITNGDSVRGKLLGSAQLASSRFAMIDDGLSFSVVTSRPLIKREIGREVFGVLRGNDISWQLGTFEGSALECNYTYRVASERAPAPTRRVNTRRTHGTIYRCALISIEGGHALGASYSGDRTSHSLPGLMWRQPQSRQRK